MLIGQLWPERDVFIPPMARYAKSDKIRLIIPPLVVFKEPSLSDVVDIKLPW